MADMTLQAAAPTIGKRKFPVFGALTAIIVIGVVALIVYPTSLMLVRVFFPKGSFDLSAFAEVLSAPWLGPTLLNTVAVVLAAGFCAILTASIFAWLNERTDARLGLLGDILPIIPLLVPAVAMAIGWIFLATPGAGFINGALAATLGRVGIPLQVNITSWPGLIFIYTIYFVPYVYIMVAAAFRNVDHFGAQFVGKLVQLLARQGVELARIRNGVEQRRLRLFGQMPVLCRKLAITITH